MRSEHGRLILLGATLLLVAAACGDGSTSDGPAGGSGPTGEVVVRVSPSDLGRILTDTEGRTLYAFMPDERGDSTCYGDCEATWPPLTVAEDPAGGGGVDVSLLGTTERTDGSMQVTYDGWPLYRFASDETPGDTNGQGVSDVWYVVSSGGEPVKEAASAGRTSGPDRYDY